MLLRLNGSKGTYEEQKHKTNRKMQKVNNTQYLPRFDNLPTSSWATPIHYIWEEEIYNIFSLWKIYDTQKSQSLRKYKALYL